MTFELFLNGAQVATSATLAPSATPTFLSSGYAGLVDAVVVSSPAQDGYVLDDFTFGQPVQVAAVPEPSAHALMPAGLGAIGFAWRRRHQRRI